MNTFETLFRRALPLVGLLALQSVSLLAQQESDASSTERDRARFTLANQSAARRLINKLERLAAGEPAALVYLTGQLQNAMLADIEKHRSRAESRTLSEGLVRGMIKALIDREVSDAVEVGQLQSPLPVTQATLLEKVGTAEWAARMTSTVEPLMANHFEAIFTEARLKSVLLQRHDLEQNANFPVYELLNPKLTELVAPLEVPALEEANFLTLTDWVEKISREEIGVKVFEELSTIHTNWISQKLSSIRYQYDFQIEAIRKLASLETLPAPLIRSSEIEQYLNTGLTEEVKRFTDSDESAFRIGPKLPNYGVFDASRLFAGYTAKAVEAEKLGKFLATLPIDVPNASTLRSRITANPAAHVDPAKSLELFLSEEIGRLIPFVVKAHVSHYRGTEDGEAVRYFVQQSNQTTSARAVVTAKVSKEIENSLTEARKQVSSTELNTYFPFVLGKTPLPESTIEALYYSERGIGEKFTYDDIIKLLGQDRLASRQLPTAPVLKETREALEAYFNASASNGLQALVAQMRILVEQEERGLEDLRRRVKSGVQFETLRKEWMAEFTKTWQASDIHSKTVYTKMFTLASNTLNKTLRQFYTNTDKNIPPTPPGEVPPVYFKWQKDEVKEIKRTRQEWERKYGRAYREYQEEKAKEDAAKKAK